MVSSELEGYYQIINITCPLYRKKSIEQYLLNFQLMLKKKTQRIISS